jgi:hypothetical protein
MRASIQGPNVAAPPQIGAVRITQEYPFHPASKLWPAVILGNVAAPPQIGTITTIQRYDSFLYPPMLFIFGAQGAPVALIQTPIFGKQEQPYHPIPSVFAGAPTVLPVPTVQGRIFVSKYEVIPYPPMIFIFGAQGVDVLIKPPLPIIGTQEQPSHPQSRLMPSLPPTPPITISAENRITIPKQTRYDSFLYPPMLFVFGAQGAPVGPPMPRPIIQGQEVKLHSGSILQQGGGGFITPQVLMNGVFIDAEQPFHPRPITVSSQIYVVPPPPPPVPPLGRLITVQEYPWHPLPILSSGYTSPLVGPGPNPARIVSSVKVRVRSLANLKPRVRVLSNINPRTTRYH